MERVRAGVVVAVVALGCLVATDSAQGSCPAPETMLVLTLEEVTVDGAPVSVSGGTSVSVAFHHGSSIELRVTEADAPESTALHLGLVASVDGGAGE